MPLGAKRNYRCKISDPRITSFAPEVLEAPTAIPQYLEEFWDEPCTVVQLQNAMLSLDTRTIAKDNGECLRTASSLLAAELRAYAARNRSRWQSSAFLNRRLTQARPCFILTAS